MIKSKTTVVRANQNTKLLDQEFMNQAVTCSIRGSRLLRNIVLIVHLTVNILKLWRMDVIQHETR